MKFVAVTLFIDENTLPYWKSMAELFRMDNPEELMARTVEQLAEAGDWFRRQVVNVCTMPVQPKPNDPAIVCGRRRPCPVHDLGPPRILMQAILAQHNKKKGGQED